MAKATATATATITATVVVSSCHREDKFGSSGVRDFGTPTVREFGSAGAQLS